MLQTKFRQELAKRKLQKMRVAKLDETRLRNLEFMLRNTRYPELLDDSARCIQINIY